MATTEAKYHFTVAQLEAMNDTDIGRVRDQILSQHGEREAREHLAPWHEALQWSTDSNYRQRRIAEEQGLPPLDTKPKKPSSPAPEPEPTFMLPQRPQVVVRGWSREDIHNFVQPLKAYLKRKYQQLDQANEQVAALNGRIRALEEELRATKAENSRKFAGSDARHDASSRDRRNIRSLLNGGAIERSPRIAPEREPKQ